MGNQLPRGYRRDFLLLYIMTTMLTAIAILASFGIKKHVREYMMAMLALSTGMLGVFISLDFFLFYAFWEFQLVPMYLIIGVWGGPRRIYAAVKFFIYTAVGSLLMLVAIIWIYFHFHETVGVFTTDIMLITKEINLDMIEQKWLFCAFFLAFAIKVPMFPFHTWLPDAHVEAPTAGSVILAGVLLKMGTYGFLRFNLPLFPLASVEFLPYVCGLGGDRYHLRCAGCHDAGGPQKTGGLLQCEPSRFCHAGYFRVQPLRIAGRTTAKYQPRDHLGRTLPAGRYDL